MELDSIGSDILVLSKGFVKQTLGRSEPSLWTPEKNNWMPEQVQKKLQTHKGCPEEDNSINSYIETPPMDDRHCCELGPDQRTKSFSFPRGGGQKHTHTQKKGVYILRTGPDQRTRIYGPRTPSILCALE